MTFYLDFFSYLHVSNEAVCNVISPNRAGLRYGEALSVQPEEADTTACDAQQHPVKSRCTACVISGQLDKAATNQSRQLYPVKNHAITLLFSISQNARCTGGTKICRTTRAHQIFYCIYLSTADTFSHLQNDVNLHRSSYMTLSREFNAARETRGRKFIQMLSAIRT